MKVFTNISLAALCAVTVGCGSSTDDQLGSDSASTSGGMGIMSLRITDAPIDDAAEVWVQFSEVQLRGSESTQNLDFTFDPPKSINLLELQGSESVDLFTDEVVPAGSYEEVRLIINAESGVEDTYLILEEGGEQHEMTVPSGSQSGLKLKGGFTVPANATADFTIDFDVRKSIVKSGNINSKNGVKYHLKPVLRMVNNAEVGHIVGTVDSALLTQAAGCSDDDVFSHNSVYVYEGANVTPDDIDEEIATADPVTTALLQYDSVTDTHSYEVGFLTEGDYTVSFTCNADVEVISEDNDLMFTGTQTVSVTSGQTVTADIL